MANVLVSPHIFEIAFDALTAAVGGLVILLALRVAPALTLSAHRLALRISVGVAALTEDVSSLEHLVEKADDELYRAKRAGKNRVAAVGRR